MSFNYVQGYIAISFSNCVKGEASPILLTVQGPGVGHATNCVRGEPIPFQLTVQGGTDMLLIVSGGAKSHSIDCPGGAAY